MIRAARCLGLTCRPASASRLNMHDVPASIVIEGAAYSHYEAGVFFCEYW
jgi:hypothetical protein